MDRRAAGVVLSLVIALGACRHHGVVTDGGSLAWGGRVGVLFEPVELPRRGEGYWVPPTWYKRGLRYGTDELVSMVVYAGRRLHRQKPGAVVAVADLSRPAGGPSAWHRSHQSGRDVDLVFLARDADGNPVMVDTMYRWGADGTILRGRRGSESGAPELYFDDHANWLLIRALIDNPIAEIQWIFVSDDLKQRLIDHARSIGEPEGLIQRAGYLLHQPGDSLPHDDHLHVRIYCPPSDLRHGCRDFGILRWIDRDYKYERRVQRVSLADHLASRLTRPFRLMLSLASLPVRGFVPRGA